ncbi:MAG: hypothetical protein KGL53_00790, partial [Elusimicrobia bacterium]|nr:hypothetical protein [Elusimicrobiota bacterium]
DDIAGLWAQAHAVGPETLQASYNFDDIDIAKDIVEKSRQGHKQVLIGDYSNWFPERLAPAAFGSHHAARTEAMQYVIDNLNPNLELHILKGLGSIGIQHNKYTLFSGPSGTLLQAGSFNYTKNSQLRHWENVVFTADKARVAAYSEYFQWLLRRSRPYAPDLQPEDPVLDPSDPIPQPAAGPVSLHGVPFPAASFSPDGGTEGWLVRAEDGVRKSLDILMFSPFPTPAMSQAILSLLSKGVPVRLVSDADEVKRATPLVPLVKAGLQLRSIHGPDVAVRHEPATFASKMHEKVMLFDAGGPDGLAKMGDSLNISHNAFVHNFENVGFWGPAEAAILQAHFDYVWSLANEVEQALLDDLSTQYEREQSQAAAAADPTRSEGPRSG